MAGRGRVMREGEALLFVAVVLASIPIYFLPSIIAYGRGHKNVAAVFLLNLLLGWLLVGWVGALVWSVLAGQESRRYGRRPIESDDVPNPFDAPQAAPVAVPAVVHFTCPHCRAAVTVPAGMLGMVVACGSCGRPFTATPTAPPVPR